MTTAGDLLLEIVGAAGGSLQRQVEDGLRDAIRTGRLDAGAALPSTRALADQLRVSRGVVGGAYDQLVAEGYLASRQGAPTRVAGGASRVARAGAVHHADALPRFDFRPGRPDLAAFPRDAWLRATRRALATAPSERLGYLDGRGVPELRVALAAHLDRARGTAADPDALIVTSGFAQALRLVARVLVARGTDRIAVEDPCEPLYRAILREEGLDVAGVPVDADGLDPADVAASGAGAVLVTPAHQYPTGAVLSAPRRAALVAWAQRTGALMIEDDYDAEFRYDRRPVGALQGLSPERTLHVGSASKVLAPGLRLGWVVAPSPLAADLARAKYAADLGSPAIDQLAFAELLVSGDLDRHLRRMRLVYRRRRDRLVETLARRLPGLLPIGASAGLHLLAELPADVSDVEAAGAAAVQGVACSALGPCRLAVTPGARNGLILGYGSIAEGAVEAGVDRLAIALASVAGASGGQAGSR